MRIKIIETKAEDRQQRERKGEQEKDQKCQREIKQRVK